MYFIGGFVAGLCLLYIGEVTAKKISWWLEDRRWRKSGAGQVHFNWFDMDEHIRQVNEMINRDRRAKTDGRT